MKNSKRWCSQIYRNCKQYGALASFHIHDDAREATLLSYCNAAATCYTRKAANT
ncbi:MAG: hypothetical protein KGZ80_09395 [Methylomonas sp.]|nr:hypothetical protein [Methylomonas sp.]